MTAPVGSPPASARSDPYSDEYFDGPLARWHRLSFPTYSAFLRRAAGEGRVRRALDLGCGSGRYGEILGELADIVDGADLAPAALERARSTGSYHRLLRADVETLAADPDRIPYDLVLSTEVIEHVPDPGSFLRAVAGLLAPEGVAVITTTTYRFSLFYYLVLAERISVRDLGLYLRGLVGHHRSADRFVRRLWEITGGHEHGFTAARLLRAVEEAGLEVEGWRYAAVQPLVPVDALPGSRFDRPGRRWTIPLWRGLSRLLEGWSRGGVRYGANVMVAARAATLEDGLSTPAAGMLGPAQ